MAPLRALLAACAPAAAIRGTLSVDERALQVAAVGLAKVNGSAGRDDRVPCNACNTACGAQNFTEHMWTVGARVVYAFNTNETLESGQCADCQKLKLRGCKDPYVPFHKGMVMTGCCIKYSCVPNNSSVAKKPPYGSHSTDIRVGETPTSVISEHSHGPQGYLHSLGSTSHGTNAASHGFVPSQGYLHSFGSTSHGTLGHGHGVHYGRGYGVHYGGIFTDV